MDFKKDQSQLKGVSELFTEKTLKDILSVLCNGKSVEVLGWNFGEASAKGEGYLSIVNRIKIRGDIDGVQKDVSIVVKSLPQNIGRRKTLRSTDFFENEIAVYSIIFPKFKEFIDSKGQSQLLSVPRLLAFVGDGENDFIALEDAYTLGFGPISRQSSTNAKQCSLILKTMARFHAISFAYKDQKEDEFSQLKNAVTETYVSHKFWDWCKRYNKKLTDIVIDAISKEYPGSIAQQKYTSIPFGDLYLKGVVLCSRQDAVTSVISQGDAWPPNFLIRSTDKGEEALMLDFQMARCASPVLDISFCLYSCTDKQFRDESFDTMLKIYYDELANAITLLGSDPQKLYNWGTFMKEVKEQFFFGMVCACEAVQYAILEVSEVVDFETLITGDKALDIVDICFLQNIKTQAGRRRLADIIVHAVEKGFL